MQVKTLDAIASGRRVVATETAMRGISAPPSTVTVVADGDAAAFAAAVRDAAAAGAGGEAVAAAREWAEARRARFLDQLRASAEAIA